MVDRRRERVVDVEAGGIAGRIDGANRENTTASPGDVEVNPQPVTSNPITPLESATVSWAFLVCISISSTVVRTPHNSLVSQPSRMRPWSLFTSCPGSGGSSVRQSFWHPRARSGLAHLQHHGLIRDVVDLLHRHHVVCCLPPRLECRMRTQVGLRSFGALGATHSPDRLPASEGPPASPNPRGAACG